MLICDACLDRCDEVLAERYSGAWPEGIDDARPVKLVRVDEEIRKDSLRTVPRKTFTLRAVYPATTIVSRISQARDQLRLDNPCRVLILVDGDSPFAAGRMFDRVRMALDDVAEFHEHDSPVPQRVLTAIAIPRPRA